MLTPPKLSRKQVKDADRLAFVLQLNRSIEALLGRPDVRFLGKMTNILFDHEGEGGFSDDAIRQFLKRASDRDKQSKLS